MTGLLVSPVVPEAWSPALNFGLSSNKRLSRVNLDEFLFIDDSPLQAPGSCNSTLEGASREHHHKPPRQQNKPIWERDITDTQKRVNSSTTTDSDMIFMRVSMCHHHFTGGKYIDMISQIHLPFRTNPLQKHTI